MLKFEKITRKTKKAQEYFESKLAFTLGPFELKEILNEKNIKIIDLRTPDIYRKSHIPNAISIPGDSLEEEKQNLSKEQVHILYCYTQQCHLAAKCCLMLAKEGFSVMELEGGFDAWHKSGFELE